MFFKWQNRIFTFILLLLVYFPFDMVEIEEIRWVGGEGARREREKP